VFGDLGMVPAFCNVQYECIRYVERSNIMGKYKDCPRYNVISLRISDNELQALETAALSYSLSKAQIMRQVIEMVTSGYTGATFGHTDKR
jgi:hypothetical protein